VNYKSYLERQIKERFDDLDECPDTKSRCKNIPASRELLNTMHRYTHTTTGESTQLYILYRATLDRDWQRLVKVISSTAYYSWTQRWSIDCCHFGRQYSWNFFRHWTKTALLSYNKQHLSDLFIVVKSLLCTKHHKNHYESQIHSIYKLNRSAKC